MITISFPSFDQLIEIAQNLDGKWKTTNDVRKGSDVHHTTALNALRILKYAGIADYKLNITQNGSQSPRWKARTSVMV